MMRAVGLTVMAATAAVLGCGPGTETPENGDPAGCPEGTVAAHETCIPRFDACDDLEVPVPGGGCAGVGVLPDACPEGFRADGEGGCAAVLPSGPCDAGRMALPGDTECAPVAPCGEGRWGEIEVDTDTLHVDADAPGGGDGSAEAPLRTLAEALDAAAASGAQHIAVAAGTYREAVVLDRPVSLHGRCPDLVEIVGPDEADTYALRLLAAAEVRGVSITGNSGVEVLASGARLASVRIHGTETRGVTVLGDATTEVDVSLERVLIEDTTRNALTVQGAFADVRDLEIREVAPTADRGRFGRALQIFPGEDGTPGRLHLSRGVVTGAGQFGMAVMGSEAHLEKVLIRDTRGQTDGSWGWGIFALGDVDEDRPVALTLDGVVIDGAREVGINVTYGTAQIERTTVRDTLGRAADGLGGTGLHVQIGSDAGQEASVSVRDSAFVRNLVWGLYVVGGSLDVEGVIVRDTDARTSDGLLGRGIEASYHPAYQRMAELSVRRSLVAGSRDAGLTAFSSHLHVEASHIRDTRPVRDTGWFGVGIAVQSISVPAPAPVATVVDTLVTGSTQYGMGFFSGTARIEHSLVRDTRARAADERFGDGILVGAMQVAGETLSAEVAVEGTAVVGSERAGISVFGAQASLDGVRLQCNGVDLNAQTLYVETPELRHPIELEDRGDNLCGCTDAPAACQAAGQSLEPSPPPVAP